MNKEQPTPTQRVEQLRDKIARSTDDIPPNAVALVNLALQLATELEAAQKDLEMRAIRDDGQCDLIANLRQQLADKTRECEAEQFGASKLLKQNDQLRAENTELKKDKERLDWLEKTDCAIGRPTGRRNNYYIFTDPDDYTGRTLRDAIDAAKGDKP